MPTASQSLDQPANFDRIARPYRWLEYLSFGPMLERCRFYRIPQLNSARRALVLGDGDGRFLANLLAINPALHADVVDQSSTMLHLLRARAASIDAINRIRVHQTDALTFAPLGTYDLIVTHFFLDCFSTDQVRVLAETIRPHLTQNGLWLVSEFAISSGLASLAARIIVSSLYLAFRVITGLQTRALPNHSAAFASSGLTLLNRRHFLFGLLVSELWSLGESAASPASSSVYEV
ncbi:MAG TPA: class I SAM-dependent methyltransferase [Acidobacteriaceae bacterium]|nr:class I SAM-dependent methyltransferase [Acidobacteriaceae bacterium]